MAKVKQKAWMCERWFAVGDQTVPIRFVVTGKNKKEADTQTEATSIEAFEELTGGSLEAKPTAAPVVLYPM